MATTEEVRAVAEPVLTAQGLELWDVELSGRVIRFLVDRPGGIDLDALTAVSGALSPLLDTHPEITPNGPYQLEVSSPGLERSLRTADQYRRYIGSEVNVKTAAPVAGSRRHRGTLIAASDDGVTLEFADSDASAPPEATGVIELRYEQIERTRTVLVWPVPAPAGSRRGAPSRPGGNPSHAAAEHRPKDHRS